MTINLNILIEAVKAMEMLRERADANLTGNEFAQALGAWSALKVHVDEIARSVKVEVKV